MRVLLDSWLVQDGQIDELSLGDSVRAGLEVRCWQRTFAPRAPEGMVRLEAADPQGHQGALYDLVGTVQWSCPEASHWVAGVSPVSMLVSDMPRTNGFEETSKAPESESSRPRPPEIGQRFRLRGTLAIAPEHVWPMILSFNVGIRRLWTVERILLRQQRLHTGQMQKEELSEQDVSRIRRWDDEPLRGTAQYVLELADTGH